MSFRVYVRQTPIANALEEGHASLDRCGTLRLLRKDLDRIGVTDRVTVLIDDTTMRIAIRNPENNDPAIKVCSSRTKKRVVPGRVQINLRGAIRSMKLEPTDARGRYEWTQKKDLLFICLDENLRPDDQANDEPEPQED